MNHKEWVNLVREALAKKKWTVTKLAARIDRSPEYVYRILSGRKIQPDGVKAISEMLKVENYLMG